MTTGNPLDELVPSFLALKRKVVDWCGEQPSVLLEDAKKDESLRSNCIELYDVAKTLQEHEASAEAGLIAPVNGKFREEWKDYLSRWRSPVSDVWLYNRFPELLSLSEELAIGAAQGPDDDAGEKISKREKVNFKFEIGELQRVFDIIPDDGDEKETVDDLIKSMMMLWKTTQFSFSAATQRASAAPVVLVSPVIANKVTPTDRLSLYCFWNEARKAYILGSPMASIGMARATLEVLLTEIFGAKGARLEDKIQFVKHRFPGDLKDRRPGDLMHGIQKAGDAILHALKSPQDLTGTRATRNPTECALGLLHDLKALIESL